MPSRKELARRTRRTPPGSTGGTPTTSFAATTVRKCVGLSSYDKDKLQLNSDGTGDIYFGPEVPTGRESNWIPIEGEEFFLLCRFYGPTDTLFDKSFKLPDVEKEET